MWCWAVNEVTINEAIDYFSRGVSITSDRRGFGKKRGVPDSVFWLAHRVEDIPTQLLPILVELEGSFHGAADDFEKFAARSNDEEYQYYLQWPICEVVDQDPIQRTFKYDVIGIRSSQLTDISSIDEREMHNRFDSWCQRFRSTFDTAASSQRYGDTVVIDWKIRFKMFGQEITSSIPLIWDPGPDLQLVLQRRIDPPTIPSVVVVNNKYDGVDSTTYQYSTEVRFPTVLAPRNM